MRCKGIVLALGLVALFRLGVWLWPESSLPITFPAPPDSGGAPFAPQGLHSALRTHLNTSEHFTLLSLDPDDRDDEREAIQSSGFHIKLPPRRPDRFHGFGVLGKTELREPKLQARLVAAIAEGIRANTGLMANCFNPRHGIHAVRGTQAADLVICFECSSLRIYGLMETGYLTEAHAYPIFDGELIKARVPQVKPH
jgi:hypothetical protein